MACQPKLASINKRNELWTQRSTKFLAMVKGHWLVFLWQDYVLVHYSPIVVHHSYITKRLLIWWLWIVLLNRTSIIALYNVVLIFIFAGSISLFELSVCCLNSINESGSEGSMRLFYSRKRIIRKNILGRPKSEHCQTTEDKVYEIRNSPYFYPIWVRLSFHKTKKLQHPL